MNARTRIAVIIPARNEEEQIVAALASAGCDGFQDGSVGTRVACASGVTGEATEIVWIVVDGGSADRTLERARDAGAQVLTAPPGRAAQMNAGAAGVDADVLVFQHADTRLAPDWSSALMAGFESGSSVPAWGRFDVRLHPSSPLLRVVAAAMNLRSRITGIATGDQTIFITRAAWEAVGGFPAIPLMEDIEISRRLKRVAGPPICLRATVLASSRRWLSHGVLRTIGRMWLYRLLYFCGVSATTLHGLYYGDAGDTAPRRAGHEA